MTPPMLRAVDDWRSFLVTKLNSRGEERVIERGVNVARVLTHCPEWAGVVRRNLWTGEIDVAKKPPWREWQSTSGTAWTDNDTTKLQHWIAEELTISVSDGDTDRAVEEAANANAYDPARDWFNALTWDGVQRLDTWLKKYLGAVAKNDEYLRQAGRRWLVSAVARVFHPGCDAHHMLILEGPQGLGKSRALRILGGAWFSDTPIEIGNKDAFMTMRGRLIIEMAELDSIRSAKDIETVKGFITSPRDVYRPPYGRRIVSVERRCVFAGSVNHAQYFHDPSGNRRFWPVKCTGIDTVLLSRDRDQLWAEASAAFGAGERWHPETRADGDLFESEQADRSTVDVWHDAVAAILSQRQTPEDGPGAGVEDAFASSLITVPGILDALKVDRSRCGPKEGQRVGAILRAEGYELARTGRHDTPPRQWHWTRKIRDPGEDG